MRIKGADPDKMRSALQRPGPAIFMTLLADQFHKHWTSAPSSSRETFISKTGFSANKPAPLNTTAKSKGASAYSPKPTVLSRFINTSFLKNRSPEE